MEAPAGTPSAPYTAYGLRLDSDSRWQLIEPLPTDQRALEAELQRLDAKLGALDNGSEPDLVKGCGILETRRHALEAQARARFDRLEASVSMLYEHECDQAKARYAARCEQLKLDMGKEIQREIQRLRRARDGVAVMDRRRLKRNSGNNNNSSSTANGAGGGGDAGDANGINDGYSSGGNPVTEKRRMEVLLSAAPIFRRLDKTLASDDVASDMASIKETMPTFLCQDGDGMDDDDDDDVETDDEEARELDEIRDLIGGGFKRRRLDYNADRVPEGQHVVVYRTSAKKTSHGTTAGKSRSRASRDDGDSPRRELMTGVITAATSTQVYLLTTDGSFQHIPVDDWKTGRVTVHTVATPDEQ